MLCRQALVRFTALSRSASTIVRSESLTSRKGLGAAEIHNHDVLGYKVKPPPFLKTPKTVSIIGAPLSFGQPIAGTDRGPKMLREAGLIETLVGLDWRVSEMGDLNFDPPNSSDPVPDEDKMRGKAKNCYCVGQGLHKISNAVFNAADADEFPLILGGDHSIAAGSVAGILRKRPETGIIWVDAHGDLNTPQSSPSGNLHGMPLALLMGLCDRKVMPGFEWMEDIPVLKPEQIVFVGLRDLDDGERAVLRDHKIKAFTMQHIDRWGVGGVMEMVFEYLRGLTSHGGLPPLHLSYE